MPPKILSTWNVAEENGTIEKVVLFADGAWDCTCPLYGNAKTMQRITFPRPDKPNECRHILKVRGVKIVETIRLKLVRITAEGASQSAPAKTSSPEPERSGPIRKIELE